MCIRDRDKIIQFFIGKSIVRRIAQMIKKGRKTKIPLESALHSFS